MKTKILIIDDDPTITRLTKMFLEKVGSFEVQEENNPRAAFATAQRFRPDLVLLDVDMPGMDGGEVAQQFETSPTLKQVPIIFFTGLIPATEILRHGGKWGGMHFLSKPMQPRKMVQTLGRVLAGPTNKIGLS